jgi:AraC-like DNA-binding protein
MIYFEPTLLADQFAEVARGAIEFESPRSCAPELARAVTSLFQALAAGARDLEFEETLFGSVFPMLARRQKATRPACDSVGVVAAIQRMRDDVCAPWRLRDLAAGAGLSRYQFLRAFARCAGATPHAYLLQLRALKARRRILGGASLAQAAFDSGFADQSHMTRAFARQFGFTPGSLAAARR